MPTQTTTDHSGVAPIAAADGRPVVAAVDGDALAPSVVATAAELADRLGRPLVLVHSALPDVFVTSEDHRRAQQHGEELLDRLAADHPEARRIVEVGDPARLITTIGEDAAMIVIGRRARGMFAAALLGSVSNSVARWAHCPVLIVSEPAVRHGDGSAAEHRVAA